MAAQEIVLEVRNISKSLGGKDILKDCSLNVARGELKVLIGPSGAGKSTLLQCINCLIPPDKGEIILEGEPLNRADKKSLCSFRARVGMIFQDFNLFDHLTAQDNVAIALRKVRGMSKKEASERAMDELARVGLANRYLLYPAQLSGGQKQRVAIARAGGADQHLEFAAFYGKAAILQDGLAAQLFGDMGNLQDVFGHGLSFAFKAGHSVPGGVAGNLHGVF